MLVGCTLTPSSQTVVIITATVEPVQIPSPTITSTATHVPTVTTSPIVTSITAPISAPLPPHCVPNERPFHYAVQSGDTPGSIAHMFGTTVLDVAVDNCISNPNHLNTGRLLFVPSLPEPVPLPMDAVQTCLPVVDLNRQPAITLSTVIQPGCLELHPGTVTVSWFNPPENFAEVQFWIMDAFGNTNVIGSDTDSSDGASISWTIHETQAPMVVYAFGLAGENSNDSGQVAIYVRN